MTATAARPDAADGPPLLRADKDGVATLTMNRPAARNALSVALMAAMQEEIDKIAADARVRVVVIAGNGPAFSAGHDLREMRADTRYETYDALFRRCSRLMLSLNRLPQPVIARVHGVAMAAGCQLVAACDLAVAGESARFATPGVNIGLFCSTPMVAVARNVPRKPMMEMLLLGEPIDARTALAWGLVNRVVADDRTDLAVADLARHIVEKSPKTLSIGKEAFYRQLELGLEEAYEYTSAVMARNMMTDDAAEGIDAFLARRDPAWRGT